MRRGQGGLRLAARRAAGGLPGKAGRAGLQARDGRGGPRRRTCEGSAAGRGYDRGRARRDEAPPHRAAGAMTYEIKLDVFEGPFQLLLSLIAEHRVDVCDVPIAKLTEDYVAHIDKLGTADLEVTTEFLVVAATLLALKARALLPRPQSAIDEEDERERDLLI